MNNLLKIINELSKSPKTEKSIREASLLTKIPYTTAYRIIKKNKALFKIAEKGGAKFLSLNADDMILKNYLILSEREKAEEFLKKNQKISLLKKDIQAGNYSLLLFGSRAEGKEREKSDIDLCIINEDGKKNISFSKSELLFKLEINPIFLSRKEFLAMLLEKDHNLAKEILKNHVILHNENYFWEVAWNAI